jgi:hypothetical protein
VALVLATALRAAFWFNPLLWMASQRLRIESELPDRQIGVLRYQSDINSTSHIVAVGGTRMGWFGRIRHTHPWATHQDINGRSTHPYGRCQNVSKTRVDSRRLP